MRDRKLIILTAGGSGGHVYPAQALAEELSKDNQELCLITDKRGKSNYKGMLSEIPNYSVLCGALVGKSKLFKLKSLIKTGLGVIKACYLMIKLKPKCVVGFGGYAAFPACCAAILLRIPLVIHEQNSIMSRTNRMIAKYATVVALTFKDTKFAPKNKSVVVGLPLREEILKEKNSNYEKTDKINILVLGGSQGAKIFAKAVPMAIALLPKENQAKLNIISQIRKDDIKEATELYNKTKSSFFLSPFFENMPEIYKKANLIISRAGASSIFEIATIGRASILVPLPTSADDHQTSNAILLKDSAKIFKEKDFCPEAIKETLQAFIEDEAKLEFLGGAAYKEAIVDSAKRFKQLIIEGI